jgi:hypothetical protein
MTEIKGDRQRAIADLIAEQIRHGATAADIAALVKLMRDDNQESEANEIPDESPPKAARPLPAATRGRETTEAAVCRGNRSRSSKSAEWDSRTEGSLVWFH